MSATMNDILELADRYVEVWHIVDPAERRKAVEELWAPDGEHYVRALEVRGYDELQQRVTTSHQKNVRDGGFRFRVAGQPQALRDVAFFNWEMIPAQGGAVESAGVIFMILDGEGRIRCDYQFITL
jgi:hypothetical protein